jgi:hypothetical protein
MAVRRSCREVEDPPTLVYFDGAGLKVYGEYCVYVDPVTGCATNLVVFDGTGLKPYSASTPVGQYCPAIRNAVDFDGTGLKLTSLAATYCAALLLA